MTRHRLIRREEIEFEPALPDRSRGLTRALLIGGHTGAAHIGLMSVALEDGHVVHAFYETRGGTVKWLETSAPGPPDRHSYRFERDWDYLAGRV